MTRSVLVACLVVTVAPACGPNDLDQEPPPPDATATALATEPPDRRSEPSPSPTATVTPWPLVYETPVPVQRTLDDLVALEEERFGPRSIDGRVDRAYMVSAGAFTETLQRLDALPLWAEGDLNPMVAEDGSLWDRDVQPTDMLAIVETSHRSARGSIACHDSEMQDWVETTFRQGRARHAVVYAPLSRSEPVISRGVHVHPRSEWTEEISDALFAQALDAEGYSVLVDEGGGVIWSPPTSYPVLDSGRGEDLGSGEAPVGLLDELDTLPVVRGATWTYRQMHFVDERVTRSGWVSTTVVHARHLEPDVLVALAEAESMEGLFLRDLYVLGPTGLLSTQVGRAIFGPDLDPDPRVVELARSGARVDDLGQRLPFAAHFLDDVELAPSHLFHARGATVSTPAGVFDDCWTVRYPFSAGLCLQRWYCPGVGLVRIEKSGVAPMNLMALEIADLIDYEIPPLVPVP